MKYLVDVAGQRLEVELDSDGVRVDGTRVAAHLADLEGSPVRLVTIGTELHRVIVRRGESRGAYTLWMDGYRFELEALDERTRTIRDLTAAASGAVGPRPLVAPMPGMIVRLMVQVGDAVRAGDALLVMEAMKMENELRATADGTVTAVFALPGMAVEKGAPLVEF